MPEKTRPRKSSRSTRRISRLTEEHKSAIKKYWLSGYGIQSIAKNLNLRQPQIYSAINTMNLQVYKLGDDRSIKPYLNDIDIIRLESKESLLEFLRNRSNVFSKIGEEKVDISDSDLLRRYGINDYGTFINEKPIQENIVSIPKMIVRTYFPLTILLGYLALGYFNEATLRSISSALLSIDLGLSLPSFIAVLFLTIGIRASLEWFLEGKNLFISTSTFPEVSKPTWIDDKWSLMRTNRLRLLAEKGYDLDYIASELAGAKNTQKLLFNQKYYSPKDPDEYFYTPNSVRSKLVQLGYYHEYLEKNWEYQKTQFESLSKKLNKDFGHAVPKTWNSKLKDPDYLNSLILNDENTEVEFKTSFFIDIRSTEKNKKSAIITHSALKAIGGFLNTKGGILLIGVRDDKKIEGIFDDNFRGEDQYIRDIQTEIRNGYGTSAIDYIYIEITKIDRLNQLCAIRCERADDPQYCNYRAYNSKKGYPLETSEFFRRFNKETIAYHGKDIQEYIQRNWPSKFS